MIVLHDAQIIANHKPQYLYKNPQNKLIASFFNEFNVINGEIVYAQQLKIVNKSNLKTTVKESYFKGNNYLIEANLDGEKVFFESKIPYAKNKVLFLEIVL
ncbi:hypothetical protein [Wocania arenilitoris]|uniref:hypothetical protein n=1 Tax=Wocania arenilitoris TaxID=2044858 RepID=UPI0034E27754